MLAARRIGWWRGRYQIDGDQPGIGRWRPRFLGCGGTLDIEAREYTVRRSGWGPRYAMIDQFGTTVATATGVGRKHWRVEAGGRAYEFQREPWWRRDQLLIRDGRPVGSVRRLGAWRGDAVAVLPGLPLYVQVFVLVVMLIRWQPSPAALAASALTAGPVLPPR